MAKPADEPVTLERLEKALAAISYAIMLDGPVYAPYLERLEREVAAMRASADVMSRSKQYLNQDEAGRFIAYGIEATRHEGLID